MILETERLILREMGEQDWEEYRQYAILGQVLWIIA